MSDVKQLEGKIKTIIAERLNTDVNEIKIESRLVEDLGADSLSGVEIIMDLEQAFGISIPEEDGAKFITVKEIFNYIRKLKTANKIER